MYFGMWIECYIYRDTFYIWKRLSTQQTKYQTAPNEKSRSKVAILTETPTSPKYLLYNNAYKQDSDISW